MDGADTEDRAKPYRFLLRMPEALRGELADASSRADRSLNAEIVSRLERSVRDERRAAAIRRRLRRGLLAAAATSAAAVLTAVAIDANGSSSSAGRDADALLATKLSRTTAVGRPPGR
jgi:hypothetical protein